MTARPPLFMWFDAPPRVGRGAYNKVASEWGNIVTYFCRRDFPESRKKIGWHHGDFSVAKLLILSEDEQRESELASLVAAHPDAVNVFFGFFPDHLERLRKYRRESTPPRIMVITERPGVYGREPLRTLRQIGQPPRYRSIRRRWEELISAYLPLGTLGVSAALRAGWPAEKLYSFMYCPEEPARKKTDVDEHSRPGELRMLYVGRFAKYTKGLDVLMRAVDQLPEDGWTIDFVGGYGDYVDKTLGWIKKDPRRNYLGSWPADEVCERMLDYDLCVVPSRYDGWNVVVNEALNAHIGVVATDQATSHELVLASGAGIVVPAGNAPLLSHALAAAIVDPSLTAAWRSAAEVYAHRISPDSVANYFIQIADYTFGFAKAISRPQCPWL